MWSKRKIDIKEKFRDKSDLIDKNARVNMKGIAKIPSAFKCFYGVNIYRELDSVRNEGTTIKECLRYSWIKA